MFSITQVAWITIIPALMALIGVVIANAVVSLDVPKDAPENAQESEPDRRGRGIGLAISIAFCLSTFALQTLDNHVVIQNRNAQDTSRTYWSQAIAQSWEQVKNPNVAHEQLIRFALLGLLMGTMVAVPQKSWSLIAALIPSGYMVWRLLGSSVYVQSEWNQVETAVWIGGLTATATFAWWLLSRQSAVAPQSTYWRMFLLGATSSLLAATLVFTGSIRYGTLAAVLATASGGAWLASWKWRKTGIHGVWCGPIIPIIFSLLIMGAAFSELPVWQAAFFVVTLALIAGLPLPQSNPLAVVAVMLITISPAITASGWSAREFIQTNQATESSNPYEAYK